MEQWRKIFNANSPTNHTPPHCFAETVNLMHVMMTSVHCTYMSILQQPPIAEMVCVEYEAKRAGCKM
jgi:hypothetical protein